MSDQWPFLPPPPPNMRRASSKDIKRGGVLPVSAPHLELLWLSYFNGLETCVSRVDITEKETSEKTRKERRREMVQVSGDEISSESQQKNPKDLHEYRRNVGT